MFIFFKKNNKHARFRAPAHFTRQVFTSSNNRCTLSYTFLTVFLYRMDTFRLEAINLSELVKLRIGHDNRGVGPGWFLEKVTVEDESTGKVFEFPCHRWLAKDEDDRQITRELICVNGSQQADMYMTPGEVNIKHVEQKITKH